MEVKVADALENSVRSVRSGRKIQILSVVILVFGGVVVAGWFVWRRFSAGPMWRAFSGARAFANLQNVVKFGSRPPGSSALEETRQYISMGLAANGIEVWHDNFTAKTPSGDIAMTNVIGIVPGEGPSVVVVAGHYDTARLEGIRFVGANDGGSSTALLLELARVLAGRKNRLTYWLVFFDGEEALQHWSAIDSLYGSRHMAEQLAADGRLKKVRALILVDMVGDRHLDILRESNSTPWLSALVFRSARELGYESSFRGGTYPVEDDHIAFLERGVAAVDIVDLTPFRTYHHTEADTVDKCSAQSLQLVGRVVLATMDKLERSSP
jgi:glutaminyl-peptide cyclotransferase